MSYIINLNSLRKGENTVATLKSKLKEQIQKEKDLATDLLLKCETKEGEYIARSWLESIKNINRVCEERKRY